MESCVARRARCMAKFMMAKFMATEANVEHFREVLIHRFLNQGRHYLPDTDHRIPRSATISSVL